MSAEVSARIESLAMQIYGPANAKLLTNSLIALIERYQGLSTESGYDASGGLWSERDMVLITYGDQVTANPGAGGNEPSLSSLQRLLLNFELEDAFSIVHILPFCPYSSDDGFSVIDFRAIDEKLGDWRALKELATHFDLMYDLVLNHVSQHSEWFQAFLRGEEEYANWFLDVDPAAPSPPTTSKRWPK